jgi:hypothetical protein
MSVTPGSSLAGAVHAVRDACSGNAAELYTHLVEKRGKRLIALAV